MRELFLSAVKSERKPPIRRTIKMLEERIAVYKAMVKWPALIESLERDLEALKARAAGQKK